MSKYKPKYWINKKYKRKKTLAKVHHPVDLFNIDIFFESRKKINKEVKRVKERNIKTLPPRDSSLITWAGLTLKHKNDSLEFYKNNKKRKAVRRAMIKKALGPKSTIDKQDPDLYLTGGIPGSGKTYVSERLIAANEGVKLENLNKAVTVVSADEYKMRLVKHENKHGTNSRYRKSREPLILTNAEYFHRESTSLAKKQFNKAVKQKRDIILDKTQKSSMKMKRDVNKAKKYGYDVHELGVFVKPTSAIKNAQVRFLETGRYMPPKQTAAGYKKNYRSILAVSKHKGVDTYMFFDNSPPYARVSKPVMVGRNKKYARTLKSYKHMKLKN